MSKFSFDENSNHIVNEINKSLKLLFKLQVFLTKEQELTSSYPSSDLIWTIMMLMLTEHSTNDFMKD